VNQLESVQYTAGTNSHRAGHSVLAELQPIVEAIAASRRDGRSFANRHVSVTLPATEGQTLVVSLRTGLPHPDPAPEAAVRRLDARQLRRVIGTIHENIAEPLSVAMLSSVAGLSRSYFSHAFRATVGRSPHAHIVRLRIERAMKLMSDTDASLSEIALATGFSDQAHFSKKFRGSAGTTPTQWRRLHQR
jgi:AraC-like DNA-binding protein